MTDAQVAIPAGYVGFDTLTAQIEKKLLKQGFHFNIMVVGQSGLGKSTFVNTLFTTHLVNAKVMDNSPEALATRQTTEIHQVSYAVEENGVKMRLNIVDTPGFGDQVNNEFCWEPITRYVKDQYAMYLRKELAPSREKRIPDSRVHCILYFIAPSGHSLKPIDVIVMKKLGEISNLIPVIAKSDSLTLDERTSFKRRISEEINFHGITTYAKVVAEEGDEENAAMAESIKQVIPFAIVGSESVVQKDGKYTRIRKTRAGTINVEDPNHCEFSNLRDFLIRTNLQSLVETTSYIHYEHFRTKQLMALKEASKSAQQ